MTAKRRKGFTLIELLVVVAIIGILAAMLLPALAAVKERGNRAACKSNLKQIGTSLKVYADKFRDKYPDGDGQEFLSKLYEEEVLMDPGVYLCPSSSEEPTDDDSLIAGTDLSYGGRENVTMELTSGLEAKYGSRTAFAADYDSVQHEDGRNVLFADGHVDFLDEDSTELSDQFDAVDCQNE